MNAFPHAGHVLSPQSRWVFHHLYLHASEQNLLCLPESCFPHASQRGFDRCRTVLTLPTGTPRASAISAWLFPARAADRPEAPAPGTRDPDGKEDAP